MYKLTKTLHGDEYVQRTTDNACIPFDPDNTDYQEYLKWVSEGNVAQPADTQGTA